MVLSSEQVNENQPIASFLGSRLVTVAVISYTMIADMCLAIPGKIISVEGQRVTVEYPGQTRQALAGGEPVKIGDFVMVQMGIVIKIIPPEEAEISKKAWINI